MVPGGVGVDAENGFFPRPDFCGSEQMSTLLNFFLLRCCRCGRNKLERFTLKSLFKPIWLLHRDRNRACVLCCWVYIFFPFEHAKNLLIMGPNNTKNCSLKCDFSHIKVCIILSESCFYCKKNTKNCFFAMCQNQEWGP